MTPAPPDLLAERIIAYLARHRREGAIWTGDIAYGLGERTPPVRAALLRLERARMVRRVATGSPTSWALADPEGT
jgi:hypothetical protein